jgi:hypothetical protein
MVAISTPAGPEAIAPPVPQTAQCADDAALREQLRRDGERRWSMVVGNLDGFARGEPLKNLVLQT